VIADPAIPGSIGGVVMGRIIWANDGTPAADRALPIIRNLVASTGAGVTVACVHRDWLIGHHPVLVEDHGPIEQELRHRVDDLRADGIDADLVVTTNDGGHPAQLIADLAEDQDADLIVTGNHGKGPVAGLFTGSFTSHLLKVAHRPVLVVPWRPPADDEGGSN
jgi:nucleotide-binding universal stress UspA family protein